MPLLRRGSRIPSKQPGPGMRQRGERMRRRGPDAPGRRHTARNSRPPLPAEFPLLAKRRIQNQRFSETGLRKLCVSLAAAIPAPCCDRTAPSGNPNCRGSEWAEGNSAAGQLPQAAEGKGGAGRQVPHPAGTGPPRPYRSRPGLLRPGLLLRISCLWPVRTRPGQLTGWRPARR